MEQLRQNYDAVVMNTAGTRSSTALAIDNSSQSAFPCLGRILVCWCGHLQFGTGLFSWLFSLLSCIILPVSLTTLLMCATLLAATSVTSTTQWGMTLSLTLSFFQLAVSYASVPRISVVGPKKKKTTTFS